LIVSEVQILRWVYGAFQTEEGWSMGNNDELEKLMAEFMKM
jgi:hypothetical protein